ncbi:hypothetical protein [Oceanospirillum sanctuarii]|uniref:hypothetical protein n=1 Tax=Oceanospirillum sanctuarii TaxID=1434821 RepID=UPI000A3D3B58|nr:hypothetical protein [Oceanospirillum sanctuarii]
MSKLIYSDYLYYFFLLLFKVVLDYSYASVVSFEYSYSGFHYNFETKRFLFAWFLYFIGLIFIAPKVRLRLVSDYFVLTAYLAVLTPIIVIYGLDCERVFFPVLVTFLAVWLISVFSKISFPIKVPVVCGGENIAVIISLVFVVFLVFWYFYTGVVVNLDFSKVYLYRNYNSELSSFGVFAYTNTWTYQVFNIFLIVISLKYRRFLLCFLLLFVQVFFFAASTHKSILFYPILVFGVWYYFRFYSSLMVVPVVFSFVIFLGLFSYHMFGDIWLSSLFSRRVFFVPANLTYVYIEFFDFNEKVYWSNSILSRFLDYPYSSSVSRVIGSYLGDDSLGANNGFVASGYAHAGLFGVLIYAILTSFVFSLLNNLSKYGVQNWVVLSMSIIPVRALLISSDLFTTLLTHGFIMSVFLVVLIREGKKNAS